MVSICSYLMLYLHLLLFMMTNDKYLYAQFLSMPYSLPDVIQVVHPEILEPRHMVLWRTATMLIYFAVIE
ncbi:uncharacterized protein DS421_16g530740 [Arachis hypogaea]|nr:uncharacterized protein DS421_16g530740 [Arachis hypogaea]